ncbi:MAG: phenylalanine--tRNA ligase subunit beta [Candidatus Omnitrophica bacterium]|nr:phenylalanine--tRNA ligase subunit beta [Candidatus Omnitrophota bacterium]MBD3269759.1 phenylalanine--tRNA ligase subunit beta [Candidatus Omnitrophota bacterium]
MRFNLKFVKEFLNFPLEPSRVAEALTFAGMEVESLIREGDDWIFEAEVTPNRYDWLSIIGVAREIAAVSGKQIQLTYPHLIQKPLLEEREIFIEDVWGCPYYTARSIKGVQICPGGEFKDMLSGCGLNSVNNIVDITNYCMFKWGNPLHAFDEDKLKGNIYIRKAKNKEEFRGIDDKVYSLTPENLVIADEEKIVALAGVMGAKNSEVDEYTKNIFLEGAIFSSVAIRHSRRRAGLDTESSYRFERLVSAKNLEYASQEAADLIKKYGEGDFSGFKSAGRRPQEEGKKIYMNLSSLDEYMGIECSAERAGSILNSLGFEIINKNKGEFEVKSPFWRLDIDNVVDIYEEVGRIFGYNNIPPRIPFTDRTNMRKSFIYGKGKMFEFKNELRRFLSLLSFNEIMTYSLEDKEEMRVLGQEDVIEIINPLRSQENCLRPTLLSGMMKTVKHNLNYNQKGVGFFEIADIYSKAKTGYSEMPALSMGIAGGPEDAFLLKGAIEEILKYLNVGSYYLEEGKIENFDNALTVFVENNPAGFMGKLNEKIKRYFGLKENLYYSQLGIKILAENKKEKKYTPFSLYPLVYQDISIALSKDISFKAIKDIVTGEGKYIRGLEIVDTYRGKDIPSDYNAFTLRIFYQSERKTLTSQEVESFHKQIRNKLDKKKGVILR